MEPPATFFPSPSCLEVATGGQSEEELLTALRKGSFLLKHGRHGRPKAHFFRLSACDNELRWRSASGAVKSVSLASVRDFLPGQATEVFRRYPVREFAASFSLRYRDPSGALRTLDLTCRDRDQYILWYPGLQIAVQRSIAAGNTNYNKNPAPGASPGGIGIGNYEQQHVEEQIVPGDLFIWGCASNPSFTRSSTPPPQEHYNNKNNNNNNNHNATATAPPNLGRESQTPVFPIECWPRRLTPTPVPLNSILDASTASVGRRHAAIVSAQGALYVLGEGAGGKLGRGHDNPAPVPQRTSRGLPGDGKIIATSCGDEYTAAITPDGQLFTWGRLPGESLPVVLPSLVRGGLTNISVCQVSCGPFHTAAVASDGRLFTWGEGFGGKLGHGDQITRLQPTHVMALQSMPVLQVSCGVWHTAAIVLEPPGLHPQHGNPPISPSGGGGGVFFGGGIDSLLNAAAAAPPSPNFNSSKQSDNNIFLPSTPSRSHHRRTSSSISGAGEYGGYQEGRGGALYTWGGVNEAVAFGEGGGSQRRDSNKGCLGHGEVDLYTGQTVPTRVGGPGCQLTGKGVRSISAGLHLTVALTTAGVVYQMGATGASGSGNTSVLAPWEGATAPEPVRGQLVNYFVDAIECGMHHVVVLARPIEKKVGRPVDQSIPTVFTWGRGSEGQLGTGKWDDSPSPVAIEENLKGRRAVAIAAGGATTMVVCDHDSKKFEDVGLQGKEATEGAIKSLLALLEPRSSSTRPSSAAIFNNNSNSKAAGGGAGGGGGSSRSGWLLTRGERPPSRSSFRGSSSFSFTSAASGSTGLGAGAGGSGNPLNLSRLSSSSLHSLGSGSGNGGNGGVKGIEGSYPYSIISISGTSNTSAAPGGTVLHRNMSTGSSTGTGTSDFLFYSTSHQTQRSNSFVAAGGGGGGLSRKSSLNYHNNNHHGEGGIRSNISSSSSLSQSQSAIGKFDPFGGDVMSGFQRKPISGAAARPASPKMTSSTSTPATSPGSIKVTGIGMSHSGGRIDGGSSTSSLQENIASKGRYIARLEQRLEALQLNKKGDGVAAVMESEQGDEKLKQAVVESALQYRESMKRALGLTGTGTASVATASVSKDATGVTAAAPPSQQHPPPLILPNISSQRPQYEGATHPGYTPAPTPSSISDPAVVEELLQRKQVELERQQQALAAWAEELRKKEEALSLRGKEEEEVDGVKFASSAHSQSTTPIADKTAAKTAVAVAVEGKIDGGGSGNSNSTTEATGIAKAALPPPAASVTASTPHQGSTTGEQDQEQQLRMEERRNAGGDGEDLQHKEGNKEEKEEENQFKEEEWVEQLEQGVTATFIRDLATGTSRLKRLRFSKTQFSASTASAWYTSNAHKLMIQTATGTSTPTVPPQPPPSVALSESVTTTPSKNCEIGTSVAIPVTGEGIVADSSGVGVGVGASASVVASPMQLLGHGRVDSRTMSFDAKELAQLHAELTHTAGTAVLMTPLASSSFSPSSSSPLVGAGFHQEQQQRRQQQQQEFHTPLTKMVNEEEEDDEEESTTGKVWSRSTGVVPSPPLESLFNKASTTTQSPPLAGGEAVQNDEENKEKEEDQDRIDAVEDYNDNDSSSEASLVSASSGGRGRKSMMLPRGTKGSTVSGNGNGTGLSGVVLSPPPPRRPSPVRRPGSAGSGGVRGGGAVARLRSFALSDVHSNVDSLSPTASARSLDVNSGFMRPGSQSPVNSTAAARGGGGGGAAGGGGPGLLRSVAAKIARSIIGGEDYTNISIPSPTTSASSSTEQQQQLVGQQQQQQQQQEAPKLSARSPPVLVFGGRRPKSASDTNNIRR